MALSLAKRIGLFTLRVGGLLLAVASICGGGWAAVRWIATTPRLAIETFSITGNDRATEQEIRALARRVAQRSPHRCERACSREPDAVSPVKTTT